MLTTWTTRVLVCACMLVAVLVASPAALAAEESKRTGFLEQWRAIQEEGRAAVQVEDLPRRIERCEAFLAAHPDFEERKPVLEALAEAYLETGTFDPARVGRLYEELAAAGEADDYYGPIGFVERQYLKHALPLESALRLFAMTRERLPKARARLADIERKEWRESQALSIDYSEASLDAVEGALRLVHGDAAGAIGPLERALARMGALPHDVVLRARGVEAVPTFKGGVLDSVHLGLALAGVRTGKKEMATRHYREVLGFFSEEREKKWDADIRGALGIAAPTGTAISAEPDEAADFTLKDLDGKAVKLSDYRGKIVILDFWATWCHWCLVEMPLLDKFQKAHAADVVLLTIATDRFEDRPNIKPTLDRLNLKPAVLLEDPEQLTGYDYQALPSFYVIDKAGKLALAKTGYDPETREKLGALVADLLAGKPTPGRTLARIESAPKDFSLLFKTPLSGRRQAVAIAAASASEPGQVGVLGSTGLERFAADGAPLGAKPVKGSWWRGLKAADVDGNGSREWIALEYRTIVLLDTDGKTYWEHEADDQVEFVRMARPAGSPHQDIVVKVGKEIAAVGVNSRRTWTSGRVTTLGNVRPDPRGGVIYQDAEKLFALDASGKPAGEQGDVPAGFKFAGRGAVDSGTIDFVTGPWDAAPNFLYDVDGDGARDVLFIGSRSVRAHTPAGRQILRIDFGEESIDGTGLGDLDGKPGDEIAILVGKYGLIVLGRAPRP